MNIVVGLKQIPDLQQIRFRNREPLMDDAVMTFGNIDLNALEAGVQLKEAAGGQVIVISAGSPALEDTIKEALAAGADEARLLVCPEGEVLDSAACAALLAETVQSIDDVGLVILGEGSGDNYSGQVVSRLASLLGWPQAAYIKDIQLKDDRVEIIRALEDRDEVLDCAMPAVISVMADINQPRIPSVSQILKAGKKPRETMEIGTIPVSQINTWSNQAPLVQRQQKKAATVKDLVSSLVQDRIIGR